MTINLIKGDRIQVVAYPETFGQEPTLGKQGTVRGIAGGFIQVHMDGMNPVTSRLFYHHELKRI